MNYSFLSSCAISSLFCIHGIYLIIVLIRNKIDYSKSREYIQDAIKFRLNFLKFISINNAFRGIILFGLIFKLIFLIEEETIETSENAKYNWVILSLEALNKINDYNFILGFFLLISMFYRLCKQNSGKLYYKLIHLFMFTSQVIIALIIIWQFLLIKIPNQTNNFPLAEHNRKLDFLGEDSPNITNLQKENLGSSEPSEFSVFSESSEHLELPEHQELPKNNYNHTSNPKEFPSYNLSNEYNLNNNSIDLFEFFSDQNSFDNAFNSLVLNSIYISLLIVVLFGILYTSLKLMNKLFILKEEQNLQSISTKVLVISIFISSIFILRLIYQILQLFGIISISSSILGKTLVI